jgi:hypothetical protein
VLVTNGLTKIGSGVDGWELTPMGLQNCVAISARCVFPAMPYHAMPL